MTTHAKEAFAGGGAEAPEDIDWYGEGIPFDRIRPSHVAPAVRNALAAANGAIEALVDSGTADYDGVVGRLDRIGERVARVWAPISHLNNVQATPAYREAFAQVLPEVTQFWSRLLNNDRLFARVRAVAESPEGEAMSGLRRRHLDRLLKEFVRAGAELDDEAKGRLEELRMELSRLGQQFQENVLEETAAFARVVEDEAELDGLPASAMERARQLARDKGYEGWLVTLDMPSVQAVLKHANNRALRKEIHQAYLDRCTEGPRDNRPVMTRILSLRREMADLLGYPGFPDYRLELSMARTGDRVGAFLAELVEGTKPYWERDLAEMEAHAASLGLDTLEPWDVSWVSESLKRERFDLDDEALRPWFPLESVQRGLFELARVLFGLRIREVENASVWDPQVGFFEIRDVDDVVLGRFYTDWFPRNEKRQGAWMDSFVTGGPTDDGFEPHLAFIGGNFNPPVGDRPALLTHGEVQTLFHEFGHLLHHCTSRVEIKGRAGINVAWDWVEVPSQLMENWTWEKDALDLFTHHFETGAAFPAALLDRMLKARRFMNGWAQMRQLSFATLDLALHSRYDGGEPVMDFARRQLRPFVPGDRFVERPLLPSFGHLFAGGYASAYYSYLWSESLEADVFSRFMEDGVLNAETGRRYLDTILSQGDKADPEELFRDFMGRGPDPSALITRNLGPPPVRAGVS
ncbi:MAG: M3 family metallopeptidase [Gemmatimonadota bacterium]|nr:M3 family metallopeptidase [Gemmatimonadota bacterium]